MTWASCRPLKIQESEKRNEYQDLSRELITMEHEAEGDNSCMWPALYNLERIDKTTGRLWKREKMVNIQSTAL